MSSENAAIESQQVNAEKTSDVAESQQLKERDQQFQSDTALKQRCGETINIFSGLSATSSSSCTSNFDCSTGTNTCCVKPSCNDALRLSGSVTRSETDTDVAYCWLLTVDNKTSKDIVCASISLDIRSYQTNQVFSIGPGIFSTATYTITPPAGVTGNVILNYAGNGIFYIAKQLPPGESLFTLCAVFAKPAPDLEFTVLQHSIFSVSGKQTSQCNGVQTINESTLIDPIDNGGDNPTTVIAASQVTNDSDVSGATVRDALNTINAFIAAPALAANQIANDSTISGLTVQDALNNTNSFVDLFKFGDLGTLSLVAGGFITAGNIFAFAQGNQVTFASGEWVVFDNSTPARVLCDRSVGSTSTANFDYVGQVRLMYVGASTALAPFTSTSRWGWTNGADFYHGIVLVDHTNNNTSPGVSTTFTPGFYEFTYTCTAGKNIGIAPAGSTVSSTVALMSKGSKFITNSSGNPVSVELNTLITGPRQIDLSAAYGLPNAGTTALVVGDFVNLDSVFYGTGTFSGLLTVSISS